MTIDERENVHKNLLSFNKEYDLNVPPPYDNILIYRFGNVTNILCSCTFCAKIFDAKNYKAKTLLEKSCAKHFCTKKILSKILMRLTPGVTITQAACRRTDPKKSKKILKSSVSFCAFEI